ncbi:MAG TPA: hypothetical protein VHL31_04830 [Geminicoccus sp.]|jgi:hypothetical protein|uniref:hypothetical protein n=1 Tax=Geminicoccus sp. TaxID=2024832 RepID=UPI002E33BE2A|nr:hypothetical protein [Geminicoccus sp.]HEX2525611.1 hypothetical protein [Geminicoccus sp.]
MSGSGTVIPGNPKATEQLAAMTTDEIVARIAVVRGLIEVDPWRIGPLLSSIGAGLSGKLRPSTDARATLALLDELETLVAMLAAQRDATALEIEAGCARRRARQAYTRHPQPS